MATTTRTVTGSLPEVVAFIEHSVMAQRIDKTGVLDDASLEREDADSHQPRSARRWGAGRSATLMPTMASPRAREARRTTAG